MIGSDFRISSANEAGEKFEFIHSLSTGAPFMGCSVPLLKVKL